MVEGSKAGKVRRAKETAVAYAFMFPALVIIFIFTIIPIFASLGLMFFDYSVLGKTRFIGLGNFIKAFSDREFIIAIKNSLIFVAVVPVIQILAILLSLLANMKLPGIGYLGFHLQFKRCNKYPFKRFGTYHTASWLHQ